MGFQRLPMSKECKLKAFLYANTSLCLWVFFFFSFSFFWKQKHNGTSVISIYIWISRIHFPLTVTPESWWYLSASEAWGKVGVCWLPQTRVLCRNQGSTLFLQKQKIFLQSTCSFPSKWWQQHYFWSGMTWKHLEIKLSCLLVQLFLMCPL